MKPILSPPHNADGPFQVAQSGLLIDGRAYYRTFYEAALKAERSILISGWQFDSEVALLRGDDLKIAAGEIRLLPFLKELLERRRSLEIYILAWDFSILFSLEREWFQDWIFNWAADRLRFRFDSRHPVTGSHHQKFVVIDGTIAFAGGMDLCSNRWDDRRHSAQNPDRMSVHNETYHPYHDLHAYVTGYAARHLHTLFIERWRDACGEAIFPATSAILPEIRFDCAFPLCAPSVFVSRTSPRTLQVEREPAYQIRSLYEDAIAAAQQLIYIENQYFSSTVIHAALLSRMRNREAPRLQIILILPRKPEALTEELFLGVAQMKLLQDLREVAAETGHALGIYYVTAPGVGGREHDVYIHSKLLIVDDLFLTVGSANTTNRSMGLDSELNLAWQGSGEGSCLEQDLRRLRIDLLLEHTGLTGLARWRERQRLRRKRCLVEHLNAMARRKRCRLRVHPLIPLEEREWLREIAPADIVFDPEKPIVDEEVYELFSAAGREYFLSGLGSVAWVGKTVSQQEGAILFDAADPPPRPLRRRSLILAIIIPVAVLLWLIVYQARKR